MHTVEISCFKAVCAVALSKLLSARSLLLQQVLLSAARTANRCYNVFDFLVFTCNRNMSSSAGMVNGLLAATPATDMPSAGCLGDNI